VVGTIGKAKGRSSPEAEEIQQAIKLRQEGHPNAIVSEDYWESARPLP
jgi:hypothetical protein